MTYAQTVLYRLGVVAAFLCLSVGCWIAYASWRSVEAEREWQARHRELDDTIRRAAPLIQAISRYQADRGSPPDRLSQLIPRYLPSLPEPGTVARNGWIYRRGRGAADELAAADWALMVPVRSGFCPKCGWSFGDTFAYHSSGRYRRSAYGGILERVGTWAYYHE